MALMFSQINTLICANSVLLSYTPSRNSAFIIVSLIAKNYPSEILEGRLYLGDQFHTADKQIMKHLRVTHIINISDKIPCYFEDSSKFLAFLTVSESLKI